MGETTFATNSHTLDEHYVGQLSPFLLACFTLNYIIGTGFLTLPWAFEVGGILLSTAFIALTCFISAIGGDYILSAMARADALTVVAEAAAMESETQTLLGQGTVNEQTYQSVEKSHSFKGPRTFAVEFDGNVTDSIKADVKNENYLALVKEQGRLLVSDRKFELTELCKIFLGQTGFLVYGISSSLDIYGFLWVYSAVFGSAISKLVPLFEKEDEDYCFWLAIFAAMVLPVSMLNLSEQALVQVFLSGCRILMIALMVTTPLVAYMWGSGGDVEADIGPVPHFGKQTEAMGASLVDLRGIHKMFPAIVFSLIFHQAVPGLADEMHNKSKIGVVFGYTFLLCGLCYGLLGIVGAWYFGEGVYQSANLNWSNYHGGTGTYVAGITDDKMLWIHAAPWAHCIRTFVVIFPALDVISAFPLYAYVLGNTLLGLVHAENVQELQRDRRVLTFYRALGAIPPVVGALYVRELGVITDYSGLVGLAIAFCFPALLHMKSEQRLRDMGAPYRTRYERAGSSKLAATAVFWFGVLSIIFCFALLAS